MNHSKRWSLLLFLSCTLLLLVLLSLASIVLGSTQIELSTILEALKNPDLSNQQHIVLFDLRIPRTIGDLLIGASFACAGALMQGMSKNPLADSGILGINAGASFALAICVSFLGTMHFSMSVFASFLGAGFAMLLVFGLMMIKGRKLDSVRLVLAGLAVSMLLTSLAQGISILFQTGQDLTFWSAGGVGGIRMEQLIVAAPILLVALIASILISKKISILSLGDESATSLGLQVEKTKTLCLLITLLLAGPSVALAGPIAFVGLLTPHIVRFFVGSNYQAIIPACMPAGAILMVGADLISRLINAPRETPIGLVFALLGVPMFIYLARKGMKDHV